MGEIGGAKVIEVGKVDVFLGCKVGESGCFGAFWVRIASCLCAAPGILMGMVSGDEWIAKCCGITG